MFSNQSSDKNFHLFLLDIISHHFPAKAELWRKTHQELKSEPNERKNIHWKQIFTFLLKKAMFKGQNSLEWQTLITILEMVSNIELYLVKQPGSSEDVIKWRKDKEKKRSNFISKCEEKKSTISHLIREGVERFPSSLDKQSFLNYLEQNATAIKPLYLSNLNNFNALDMQQNENDFFNLNQNEKCQESFDEYFSQRPTEDKTISTQQMEEEYIYDENFHLNEKRTAYSNYEDEEEKINSNALPPFMSLPPAFKPVQNTILTEKQKYYDMEQKIRRLEEENNKLKNDKKILENKNTFLASENFRIKEEIEQLKIKPYSSINSLKNLEKI